MTPKEIAVVGFFALMFVGLMGFARGDLDARWAEPIPQYVQMAQVVQDQPGRMPVIVFRGTFGGDL